MTAFKQMWEAVQNQLFAVVPAEYKRAYFENAFHINMSRFITMSFVLVVMDTVNLAVYTVFNELYTSFNPYHVAVLVVKISLMLAFFFIFAHINNKGYRHDSLVCRNWELIYPIMHFVGEALLFITGPQDLGALIRYSAVPFICGSIPIIKQNRSFVMMLCAYIFGAYYLDRYTAYTTVINVFGFSVNYWIVVFPCAIFISFTVYSWSVNVFAASQKELAAGRQLSSLNNRLQTLAEQDMLTGLMNRRGFQSRMDATWEEHRHDDGCTVSAIMFDIDFFKRYNDRYGHMIGDESLTRITGIIRDLLDDDIMLSRYGGEEFLAICYNRKHNEIVAMAEMVRIAVEELKIENPDSEVHPYITVSVGVTTQKLCKLKSYDKLIEYVDRNMFNAKSYGRNQLVHTIYSPDDFRDADNVPLITSNDDAHRKQEFDEDYMQRVLKDISADCTFIYDFSAKKLEFSRSAVEQYSTPNSVMNPSIETLADYVNISPVDKEYFIAEMNKAIASREPFVKLELHLVKANYLSILVAVRAQCAYTDDGRPDLIYGSVFSIQKMMEYNHYLREQSMTNSVTLLPNRQKLNQDLKTLIEHRQGCGYMIFIDINNFREINSTYSHNIGDKVLLETAQQLSKLASSENAPVYNYNVDQFIITLHNASNARARQFMYNISQYFHSQCILLDGLDLKVDFTMLAVEYDCHTTNLDDLFVDLDIAIQYAKYNKPDSFFFLTDAVRSEFLAKVGLSNSLKRSVENDFEGFNLYYQPIFDGSGKLCLGAEALLRWEGADGNIVPPNIVIPELERTALMPQVETWIINEACRTCSQWIASGADDEFFMHINLSAAALGRESLMDDVHLAISNNHLALHNIVLEAIETAAIFEMKSAVHTLETLRNSGVRIAIDDFGTGYSSLSYLRSLPADEVKIDRYFINNIDSDPASRDFLSSIVGMAKSMGFLVCMEGVETLGQFEALKAFNIDYLQGFFFGRPIPSKDFYAKFISPVNQSNVRIFQSAITSR